MLSVSIVCYLGIVLLYSCTLSWYCSPIQLQLLSWYCSLIQLHLLSWYCSPIQLHSYLGIVQLHIVCYLGIVLLCSCNYYLGIVLLYSCSCYLGIVQLQLLSWYCSPIHYLGIVQLQGVNRKCHLHIWGPPLCHMVMNMVNMLVKRRLV